VNDERRKATFRSQEAGARRWGLGAGGAGLIRDCRSEIPEYCRFGIPEDWRFEIPEDCRFEITEGRRDLRIGNPREKRAD
jgi:hypothetical protein